MSRLFEIDQIAFEKGYADVHQAVSEGVHISEVENSLGLVGCGISGFACVCNQSRVGEEIDIYDYVDGIKRLKHK
ncbi:MAG: hypothetical protein U5L95_00250 [Candidatus Saccharibacteria bacterium]|nr:hypothetical protein [Candidatus Saccharibacteria bacterium]